MHYVRDHLGCLPWLGASLLSRFEPRYSSPGKVPSAASRRHRPHIVVARMSSSVKCQRPPHIVATHFAVGQLPRRPNVTAWPDRTPTVPHEISTTSLVGNFPAMEKKTLIGSSESHFEPMAVGSMGTGPCNDPLALNSSELFIGPCNLYLARQTACPVGCSYCIIS